ncbi:MAG: sigma-70 family RNA polymerase sigma factor, partial [Oscillospiraceae bacterium]|nr:sigma-70 family RNA polymerase sigma factor [Oscillospiraceae bacterium]
MKKENLTDHADFLLRYAARKCGNISDAQDLVQETLLAALTALEKGKVIDDPTAWLTVVLNRKYYDMLRRKYRKPVVSLDVTEDIPIDDPVYDRIEKSAEAEEIRRCIAYQSRIYRQVLVRFYMHGESIKSIAAELDIPENTIKSRLDAGRKHIRKEFNMENYTSQSYEPDTLYMSCSGRSGMKEEPFSLVGNDKIAMNLLILAYEKPITVPELAKAIGIPTAYIEPIIDRFVDGELMRRTGDKVYSDFIIYTEKDRTANFDLESSLADKLYADIWEIMQKGFSELHDQELYKKNTSSQQIKLDSFFAVRTVQNAVRNIRDSICGGLEPFDNYPDRPNGGKWYAIGNRYPANYNWDDNKVGYYSISGEAETALRDYCDLSVLMMCEYDTALGTAHLAHHKEVHSMSFVEIMQMLYAIHSGREDDLPIINSNCFETFDFLI